MNPHNPFGSADFKSAASADSAIPARRTTQVSHAKLLVCGCPAHSRFSNVWDGHRNGRNIQFGVLERTQLTHSRCRESVGHRRNVVTALMTVA